jgi:hypothetical protein
MNKGSKDILTSESVKPNDELQGLYKYLKDNNFIKDLKSNMKAQLHIKAREVLKMIKEENPEWEKYVPMKVAEMLKRKNDYQ